MKKETVTGLESLVFTSDKVPGRLKFELKIGRVKATLSKILNDVDTGKTMSLKLLKSNKKAHHLVILDNVRSLERSEL